jgi:transcriptional regulator with XRE-family HTH domain
MELGQIIGENTQRLRQEQNMTLSRLSELSGLSKVMLYQIEKGTANPTALSLAKITAALQVNPAVLLEAPDAKNLRIQRRQGETAGDRCHMYSYFPRSREHSFELHGVELEPGGYRKISGLEAKTSKYVLVTQGTLTLSIDGDTHQLSQDDGLCFNGRLTHTYVNDTDMPVRMIVIVDYLK